MRSAMAQGKHTRGRATLIGASAVLICGTLATLTVCLREVPPFQLLAMAFAVAFAGGSLWLLVTGGPARFSVFAQPTSFWFLAIAGLFAYHALYFVALRLAPAAEANLINYLWPLLIVLFAGLLPGNGRLRPRQALGALMGLAGTALLIVGGSGSGEASGSAWGYGAAVGCAFVWSGYSVLNRRFAAVPSKAMIGICGAVALLALVAHFFFEHATVALAGAQYAALAAMGVGPLGLAFLTWDHGTKHGDLPVLSTLLLVLLGFSEATPAIAVACALVVGGACVATGRSAAAGAPAGGGR